MIPPSSLSPEAFARVLDELKQLLGAAHVLVADAELEPYRDKYAPAYNRPDEIIPACVLRPATVAEIQGILAVANKYKVPLWVISRGRNYGYGGQRSVLQHSVLVDLVRMNRILELNEKHAYAVVEPGVSREELWAEIQTQKLNLWQDGPSSPWGSIIGSTSDKGIGYGLLGDRMSAFCGLEVVLPDGDIVRTGMGALSTAPTWQHYRWGFGPWVDGLFTQSNYGIITKMGIWLIRQPPCFRSAEVYVADHDAIIPLLDILRELRLSNVIENSVSGGGNYGGHVEWGVGAGGGRGVIPGVLPGWRVRLGFYGHERVVDARWDQAREAFSIISGVTFHERKFHAPYDYTDWSSESKLAAGVIAPDEFPRWDHHLLFTAVVLPFDGATFMQLMTLVREVYHEYGVPYVGSPFHNPSPRALIVLLITPLAGGLMETLNKRTIDNDVMVEMRKKLAAVCAAHGWGEYRTPTDFMDDAARTYDFNGGAQRRLHERLKDALDPHGVLMPGKYGIWPKGMRSSG